MKEFIARIARMTKEGQCSACRKDGEEPNEECEDHEPFIMENDDNFETLSSLITEAREILRRLEE